MMSERLGRENDEDDKEVEYSDELRDDAFSGDGDGDDATAEGTSAMTAVHISANMQKNITDENLVIISVEDCLVCYYVQCYCELLRRYYVMT